MERRDNRDIRGNVLTVWLIEHGECAQGMVEFPLLEILISRINFSA